MNEHPAYMTLAQMVEAVKERDMLRVTLTRVIQQRDEAQREAARLREDKERIDFLNKLAEGTQGLHISVDTGNGALYVVCCDPSDSDQVRDGIDAAQKEAA